MPCMPIGSVSLIIGDKVWRSVPSAPGVLASSSGRVMSSPYTGYMPYGGTRIYYGKPSFGFWAEGSGEGRFVTCIGKKNYKVARLVCEAFHGPAPKDKPICMHLDEASANNVPDNLAWGTQKENLNAPGFIEYCCNRTGDNNPRNKGRKRKCRP